MKALLIKHKPIIKIASTILIIFILFNTEGKTDYHPDGDGISLQGLEREYKIGSEVSILKDIEGGLKVDEVASAPLNWNFMPVSQAPIKIGFPEKKLWIEFLVDNRSGDNNWLLVVPQNSVRTAVLYTPLASGGYAEEVFSSQGSSDNNGISINDIVFDLEMENNTSNRFYLNVEADRPLQLPLSIWNQTAYENSIRTSLIGMGIFMGLVIFMVIYYLLHFYKKKQKVYLYFLVFALSLLTTIGLMSDYSIINLFPLLAPASRNILLFTLGLSIIFGMLYTGSVLEKMNKGTKAREIFKYTCIATILITIFQFISFTLASVVIYFISLATLINILWVTAASRKYEHQFIKFHIVSMMFLLVSLVLYGMLYTALIPLTGYYEKAFWLTSIAGILFSSLALAAKESSKVKEMEKRERKSVQRLQLEMESLKQADANKNELLEVTAHSLRTPLYGMIGNAESLMEESMVRLTAAQSKQLELIIEHGKKLAQKVNDVTDFSRMKQNILDIHVEPVSINQLVEEVLEVCRPLLKSKDIHFYGTLSQNLPHAVADPYRIQQILYNLIDNAIKQTDKGEIVISTKRMGNQITVTVRDTGNGIEQERIKNLFEPHKHGDDKNIGIGLHISKRLIELHGGWLKAESVKGEGSTFTFTLPAYTEELIESAADDYSFLEEISVEEISEPLPFRLKSSKRVRVLVVEKEPLDRNILISQLQNEDYIVLGTRSGSEAMKILETQQIDLVILDGTLEDMDGNELSRRIRKKFLLTEMPILMLSTKMGVKEKMDAFVSGANDYLIKPCDKEEFLLRVDSLANLKIITQEITNLNYVLERNVKEKTMALEITNMNLVTVNDEIQEIEKSRNEMLSSISHELGTPITLIHSYIQAVKESLIDEKNPRYLDMIHKKLLLLERLTEDLVELGKYKSGNMTLRFESIPVDDWLKKLMKEMEADISQSGRIFENCVSEEQDVNLTDYHVLIDVDRMDQVFSNILWNAVKNTSSVDGKISVSTEICLHPENDDVEDSDQPHGEVIINISDTGYGIPEEILPHIFDRFFKDDNKAEKKGSGLGLAIAKEIVQSHKGKIWAESKVGVGSSFFIALPLYK